MFTLVRDIPFDDIEDGLPALLTMVLMPLTFNITVGIGAGFISWVFLKVVRREFGEIHSADVGRRDRVPDLLPDLVNFGHHQPGAAGV